MTTSIRLALCLVAAAAPATRGAVIASTASAADRPFAFDAAPPEAPPGVAILLHAPMMRVPNFESSDELLTHVIPPLAAAPLDTEQPALAAQPIGPDRSFVPADHHNPFAGDGLTWNQDSPKALPANRTASDDESADESADDLMLALTPSPSTAAFFGIALIAAAVRRRLQ